MEARREKIGTDETARGFTGRKCSLYFVRVSSFGQWVETESEKQTITDICCQLSERERPRETEGEAPLPHC